MTNSNSNFYYLKIYRQIGPAIEVQTTLTFPAAFLDYLKTTQGSLNEYCNKLVLEAMITELDNDHDLILETNHKEIGLEDYTIPKFLAQRHDEIMETYLI
jgi:hypothetical protein